MTKKDSRNKEKAQKRSARNQKIAKHFAFLRSHPALAELIRLFEKIFQKETEPTRINLMMMAFSILYTNSCPSVRGMFNTYIRQHSEKSLSAMYNTLNNAKLFESEWQYFLLDKVLSSPKLIKYYPILYIIDDTLVEKYGNHFELWSKLFNHNSKNGSSYLNGHCFVSIVLAIPMIFNDKICYIKLPLLHQMWDKLSGVSKLEMAKNMILNIDNVIKYKFQTIVMCDSWYPKGPVLELHNEHQIPFICAARSDTALYEIPNIEEGQRGRKRIRGEKLSKNLEENFDLSEVEGFNFLIGSRKVMTEIFGHTQCTAYVTKGKGEESKSSTNLFLATNDIDVSDLSLEIFNDKNILSLIKYDISYFKFGFYKMRWFIESCYYELKIFWDFEEYKVRSKKAIERLINIQNLVYAIMSIFPYIFDGYSKLRKYSAQEIRFHFSEVLAKTEFMSSFVEYLETDKKSSSIRPICQYYIENILDLSDNENVA